MKITHVSLELAPFSTRTVAAVGASELLSAQASAGDSVVVVSAVPEEGFTPPSYLARRLTPFVVDAPDGKREVLVMEGLLPGCRARLFLLELPPSEARTALFGKAALALLPTLAARPELVHLHDDTGCDVDDLREALGGATVVQSVYDAHSDSRSLVAAIQDADGVVTPCSGLAEEAPGRAVAEALRAHPSTRIVLAGVDPVRWNPALDAALAAPFAPEALSGKTACRQWLQRKAELAPRPESLVLAVWARQAAEPDAVALVELLDELGRLDVQIVALVSDPHGAPDPLSEALRGKPFGWVAPDASESTVREVLAGADAVLLPDAAAPLGQRSLIAMRYGVVPVARAVQAHRRLLVEYDSRSTTGGAFLYGSPDELFRALHRLVMVHRDPEGWASMVRANALVESGWSRPLSQMAEIYRKALAK